jgi:hypothetical protein
MLLLAEGAPQQGKKAKHTHFQYTLVGAISVEKVTHGTPAAFRQLQVALY